MASWMIHLRVTERLLALLPVADEERFVLGTMAPDSGVPVEGGYEPAKEVSHFRTIGEDGRKTYCWAEYAARYLSCAADARARAFHLGYLTHLMTDAAWDAGILREAKSRFAALLAEDAAAFWRMVKRDWYDMDFLFLRAHPDFRVWRVYCDMNDMRNGYVDFFSETAFADRRAWIVDFYRQGVENVQPRETYLSWETLDAFVENTAREIVKQLQAMGLQA